MIVEPTWLFATQNTIVFMHVVYRVVQSINYNFAFYNISAFDQLTNELSIPLESLQSPHINNKVIKNRSTISSSILAKCRTHLN